MCEVSAETKEFTQKFVDALFTPEFKIRYRKIMVRWYWNEVNATIFWESIG